MAYFLIMCSRITMHRVIMYKDTNKITSTLVCDSIPIHIITPIKYGTMTFRKLVNPDFWATAISILNYSVWQGQIRGRSHAIDDAK